MNLDAVLRITAKVAGQGEVTRLEQGISSLEKKARTARDAFGAVASSAAWQAAAVGAAAVGAGLVVATRAAIDFESSVAEVRKVMSGIETPQALSEIRGEILQLSREMPITAAGFADIYAAAGQAGIAREEVRGFAVDVAQMAVAFDMTAADAGNAMAKLRASLGLSQDEVRLLADSLNYLSNNTASTAAELTEFALRAGTTGKAVGLTGQQTAAFGAAMIGAGVNTETAATSFNNMIKALSRGRSMTARQVSALERLGLATKGAAKAEGRYTQAVEEESRQRLEVARDETDALSKEINRRYRDISRQQQDAWDDESRAYARALDDRTDLQVQALEYERDRAIAAAEARAEATGRSAANEVELIQRAYDRRIVATRRAAEDELRQVERNARDRRQVVIDAMDDQRDAELDAVQSKYQELEREEKAYTSDMVKRFKESGGDAGAQAGEALARNLQSAPLQTIQDIFQRIRGLSKDQQLSVISDLFGDEARGLVPLITNTELLGKALGLVGDQSQYAGSMAGEYAARAETTANKLQLAKNNAMAFAIVIGEQVLPSLTKLAEAAAPVLQAAGDLAARFPVVTQVAVLLAGAISGVVLALPAIASAVFLLGQAGFSLAGIGTMIAGLMSVIATIPGAIGAVVSGALPAVGAAVLAVLKGIAIAIGAFFSAPAGVIALVVAGVAAIVAVIWTFRDEIGAFFSWLGGAIADGLEALWQWGEPIREFWAGVWKDVQTVTQGFWDWFSGVIRWGVQAAYEIAWQLFVQPWVTLWNRVLREPVTRAWTFIRDSAGALARWLGTAFSNIANGISAVWRTVGNLFRDYVVTPITNLWDGVVQFIQTGLNTVVQFATNAWNAVRDGFDDYIIAPVRNAWQALVRWLLNGLNGFLRAFANGVNGLVDGVNRLIGAFNALPGPDIGYVPRLSVPQFASGAVVDRPTLAMVGEGGEREYVVPESKMAQASKAFLSGARGADVLSGAAPAGSIVSSGSGAGSPTTVRIDVRTGPVMELDGKRWVQVEDLEAAMRQTANAVMGQLRSPGTRVALGLR